MVEKEAQGFLYTCQVSHFSSPPASPFSHPMMDYNKQVDLFLWHHSISMTNPDPNWPILIQIGGSISESTSFSNLGCK